MKKYVLLILFVHTAQICSMASSSFINQETSTWEQNINLYLYQLRLKLYFFKDDAARSSEVKSAISKLENALELVKHYGAEPESEVISQLVKPAEELIAAQSDTIQTAGSTRMAKTETADTVETIQNYLLRLDRAINMEDNNAIVKLIDTLANSLQKKEITAFKADLDSAKYYVQMLSGVNDAKSIAGLKEEALSHINHIIEMLKELDLYYETPH